MDILFVYVTTPDAAMAQTIGRAVVEEGLAACANILPGMQSVYVWQGKLENAEEVVLILKTTTAVYPRLEARVRALHSYDTPCIVALPLAAADSRYVAWIRAQIQE